MPAERFKYGFLSRAPKIHRLETCVSISGGALIYIIPFSLHESDTFAVSPVIAHVQGKRAVSHNLAGVAVDIVDAKDAKFAAEELQRQRNERRAKIKIVEQAGK